MINTLYQYRERKNMNIYKDNVVYISIIRMSD